jgi:Tfp pilus assembly protein PilO
VNRRNVFLSAVAVVGVVALWWVFVFSPKAKDLNDAHDKLDVAKRESQTLAAQLNELRDLQRRGPETEAQLSKLNAAIPKAPSQASFITQLNGVAHDSGITWQSVTMQEPTAGTAGGPPTTAVQIKLGGGFSQVLAYLAGLEDLNRLVVVDSVTVNTGGDSGGGGVASGTPTSPGGGVTSHAGDLSVTVNGRVFSQTTLDPSTAAPAATTGSGGPTAGTTDTTAVPN